MQQNECMQSLREKLNLTDHKDYSPNAALLETPVSLIQKLLGDEVVQDTKKIGMSKERITAALPNLRTLFSFYRAYPDLLLDIMRDPESNFELRPYQRIFLRVIMRHRYVYGTFPRGYSKSFIAILANYLKCILYPNSKVFLVSPGKQQSMSIIQEKVKEIWDIWPGLRNEIIEGRDAGASKMQANLFSLQFKNGSFFDVIACSERSRGLRRTSGIIEESAKVDGTILSSVIIPTMNISRRSANGREDPNDMMNKSQCYITSAGETQTFAYEKLANILIWSVLRPDESFCFGGTWRPPVVFGLLNKNFVSDLRDDGTYSEATFAREYESQWTGSSTESFFSEEEFDRCRTVQQSMTEAPEKMPKGARIVLGYDVGRNNDLSTCVVIYMEPQANGTYIKKIVNIYAWEGLHFADQASIIKKLVMRYNAYKLVIDANGPGLGLVDFLTIKTKDLKTGVELPALGIDRESDTTDMYRNFYKVEEHLYDEKIWLIRASDKLNSQMHNLVSTQIASGKVRFLIDDTTAREAMSRTRAWATYTEEQKVAVMQPFVMTRILREEMMNLRRKTEDTTNITLKKISSSIKKDKFSAFEYALWYCRKLETGRHKRINSEDLDLISTGSRPGAARRNFSGERKSFTRTRSFGRR